jgi:hypothetical protein
VAALVGVCALVAVGAEATGAKTAVKGTPTSGSAFVAVTHVVAGKPHAAGNGVDKILGPAASTLVFASTVPTSQPGVVKVTAKPMVIWLRTGTLSGTGTVLINTNTGQVTGRATFKGATGTLKGHSLVVTSIKGVADLAKGRFHYTYTGVYK